MESKDSGVWHSVKDVLPEDGLVVWTRVECRVGKEWLIVFDPVPLRYVEGSWFPPYNWTPLRYVPTHWKEVDE